MRAFIKTTYGGPEILRLETIEKPAVKADEVLVKVEANSANPADWHLLRGTPFLARFAFGLFKPKNKIPGADFAGIVEATGSSVTQLKPGDRVFGENLSGGAFAEYTAVPARVCALMPRKADFATMAAVPIAGLTALQALVTHGGIKAGETVLINGASGGVGHFAVQIAKAYGAEVIAVCSARNSAFVKKLGAGKVLAYDQENIHRHSKQYDLVLDANGNLSYDDYKRMGRRGVMVGFTTLQHMAGVLLKKALGRYPLVQFTAQANTKDLQTLASLIEAGKINVCLDKVFNYKEIPEAISYIEAMRTRGKVSMVWTDTDGQNGLSTSLTEKQPHAD